MNQGGIWCCGRHYIEIIEDWIEPVTFYLTPKPTDHSTSGQVENQPKRE